MISSCNSWQDSWKEFFPKNVELYSYVKYVTTFISSPQNKQPFRNIPQIEAYPQNMFLIYPDSVFIRWPHVCFSYPRHISVILRGNLLPLAIQIQKKKERLASSCLCEWERKKKCFCLLPDSLMKLWCFHAPAVPPVVPRAFNRNYIHIQNLRNRRKRMARRSVRRREYVCVCVLLVVHDLNLYT